MAGKDFLFDEHGLLRNEIVSALGVDLSQSETEMLGHQVVNPTDTTSMLQLLLDSDPSARWIGIYKTRFTLTPDSQIVQALRGVILVDIPIRLRLWRSL